METVLIFVSHGTLAEGVRSAAMMMLGEEADVRCWCLSEGKGSTAFRQEVRSGVRDLKDRRVQVLCDMLGGSPVSMTLLELEEAGAQVAGVFGGLNLAMALTAVMNRNHEDAGERIIAEGKESIAGMMNVIEENEEI